MIQKQDYKWVPVDPSPNFDPKRNARIIQEVIDETEAIARKKRREATDGIRERTSAVAKYLKSVEMGGAKSDLEGYFGKRELARLRGEEVLATLKKRLQIVGKTKDGKLIRKAGV